jgi:quercetin dioxygenase-like cupin family protein
MKRILIIAFLIVAASGTVSAQNNSIFPKGEKAANVHHVGNVWLSELSPADSVFTYSTAQAVFDPGARLNWQILLITDGVGYYQEKGKAKQTVRKGDIVKCQPGVEHWHGATPQNGVTYIATSPAQNGKTIWLHPVSDQEYGSK